MTATTRPYTRQQCWALAMRAGMLVDGWTMTDVRRRWRELLVEHGLASTEDGEG